MAGDFPNLSAATVAQWPRPDRTPATRGWYSPYAVTLSACATVVLFFRILSIRKSSYGFGRDDALVCVAWLFALLLTVVSVTGTIQFGFSRHMWDVPKRFYDDAALMEWLLEFAFHFSTGLTKVSVLLFFRRLDPPCTKAVKRIIYVFITLTIGYSLAFVLSLVLLCHPTATYWRIPVNGRPSERSCASQHVLYPFEGAMSSFSTLYTLLIPVLILRNIPMSKTQRLGLRVVSFGGLIVLGAGIARTVFLSRMADSTNGDATWNSMNAFIWSQLECQLSIVCASVPFLQRYLAQYPGVPIVYYPETKSRNDSVISRVNSSLSGQLKRTFTFGRSNNPRQMDISRPQMVEIPEWEFQTLESPQRPRSPADVHTYDRYLAGHFGPSPPPKDSRELFDQYRRERHGVIA